MTFLAPSATADSILMWCRRSSTRSSKGDISSADLGPSLPPPRAKAFCVSTESWWKTVNLTSYWKFTSYLWSWQNKIIVHLINDWYNIIIIIRDTYFLWQIMKLSERWRLKSVNKFLMSFETFQSSKNLICRMKPMLPAGWSWASACESSLSWSWHLSTSAGPLPASSCPWTSPGCTWLSCFQLRFSPGKKTRKRIK